MPQEDKSKYVPVTKAKDEKLKQVLYVVMVPDAVDAHGDVTSEEEVRKACHSFNTLCNRANLFHLVNGTDSFRIVESYISPVDMLVGEQFVKKGTWLANCQVQDDDLWEAIESGEVCGLSIGAKAQVETIEGEDID